MEEEFGVGKKNKKRKRKTHAFIPTTMIQFLLYYQSHLLNLLLIRKQCNSPLQVQNESLSTIIYYLILLFWLDDNEYKKLSLRAFVICLYEGCAFPCLKNWGSQYYKPANVCQFELERWVFELGVTSWDTLMISNEYFVHDYHMMAKVFPESHSNSTNTRETIKNKK